MLTQGLGNISDHQGLESINETSIYFITLHKWSNNFLYALTILRICAFLWISYSSFKVNQSNLSRISAIRTSQEIDRIYKCMFPLHRARPTGAIPGTNRVCVLFYSEWQGDLAGKALAYIFFFFFTPSRFYLPLAVCYTFLGQTTFWDTLSMYIFRLHIL